jgi:hypothetical protein
MIDLSTSTEIDASAETVWATLTELDRFAEWNPFIFDASGTPAVGASLRVRVKSGIRVPLTFRPKVIVCDKNRELRWRGQFLSRWLGAGDHTFSVEPTKDGRVRFVQHEVFTGLLPALFHRLLARETRTGFDAMNQALKERAEGARSARPTPTTNAAGA